LWFTAILTSIRIWRWFGDLGVLKTCGKEAKKMGLGLGLKDGVSKMEFRKWNETWLCVRSYTWLDVSYWRGCIGWLDDWMKRRWRISPGVLVLVLLSASKWCDSESERCQKVDRLTRKISCKIACMVLSRSLPRARFKFPRSGCLAFKMTSVCRRKMMSLDKLKVFRRRNVLRNVMYVMSYGRTNVRWLGGLEACIWCCTGRVARDSSLVAWFAGTSKPVPEPTDWNAAFCLAWESVLIVGSWSWSSSTMDVLRRSSLLGLVARSS